MSINRKQITQRMSASVAHNGTVYLCGQVCKDANEGITNQTISMLEKVEDLLEASEYHFETEIGVKTLLEFASASDYPHLYRMLDDEDESAEYLVPVRWLYTEERSQAFSEVGLFDNQNTVCKPTTPKWSHTVERLKQVWNIVGEKTYT